MSIKRTPATTESLRAVPLARHDLDYLDALTHEHQRYLDAGGSDRFTSWLIRRMRSLEKRLEAAEALRPEAKRLIQVLDNAVPNPGWRTRFLSLLAALAREET